VAVEAEEEAMQTEFAFSINEDALFKEIRSGKASGNSGTVQFVPLAVPSIERSSCAAKRVACSASHCFRISAGY
jgi:hypothetical protein